MQEHAYHSAVAVLIEKYLDGYNLLELNSVAPIENYIGYTSSGTNAVQPKVAYYIAPESLRSKDQVFTLLKALSRPEAVPTNRLIIVAPNVANYHNICNLMSGNWTPDTSVQTGFSAKGLNQFLTQAGWKVIARQDVALGKADLTSLLHTGDSLAGQWLHEVANTFNPDNHVQYFVWLLAPYSEPNPEKPSHQPQFSILMRTQGQRNELLLEALYSVYAQTFTDYEVVLCYHHPERNQTLLTELKLLLKNLPPSFQQKIRVIEANGPGRSTPLNALLKAGKGRYFTFLDDDDLLFPSHLDVLQQGVNKHGDIYIFQTFAVARRIVVQGNPTVPTTFPYTVKNIINYSVKPFSPVKQQYANLIPITNYSFPRRLVEEADVQFLADFELGEDWQFLNRIAQFLKVITLPQITTAINIRNNGTGTVDNPALAEEWQKYLSKQHDLQSEHPLLMEGRAARLIAEWKREDEARILQLEKECLQLKLDLQRAKIEREVVILRLDYEQTNAWVRSMEQELNRLRSSRLYRLLTRIWPLASTAVAQESAQDKLQAEQELWKVKEYLSSEYSYEHQLGEQTGKNLALGKVARQLSHELETYQSNKAYRLWKALPIKWLRF
ncbi:MAG TPA: glycosyltransferase family A protein [Chloroflexia bacterium]|nr:glycosyltransferase family A protein [Chloroflexia bacterium]